MKSIKMKGKTVEEATKVALEVLKVGIDDVNVRVIGEGKPAMMGILGGEEAEIEMTVKGSGKDEAQQILQTILDKMGFMAIVDAEEREEGAVLLSVKGEDMGRIIGKEGAMLKSLEVIVNAMAWKITGQRIRINIDAGGYKEKREKVLEKLAAEIAEEVEQTGKERVMPFMSAADRRVIHMYIKNNPKITSFSKGEGKDRRMVIAPK
ncbi:MAG: KH domain-containing protein [Candidatus Margulisbacteria bacterium]|nr:KH domain-containing protein [Candidatus Margulisiibacteriota bacterium]